MMDAAGAQFPDAATVEQIVASAEDVLGYEFNDKQLLVKALTHPSAVEELRLELSYERMEFLGDAFLGGIVAREIYHRFPQMNEGGMTRLKSAVVSGATLSDVMAELGFADLIIFGESERGTGGRGMHSALENVYESIVAALVLDGGVDVARDWVLRTLGSHITESAAQRSASNPKSRLQEIMQEHGTAPAYELVAEDGPPHDRVFTMNALRGATVIGTGSGRTKKEAEAAAAQDAIGRLESSRKGRSA